MPSAFIAQKLKKYLSFSIKDGLLACGLLTGASLLAALYRYLAGQQADVAILFVLAVLLISRTTSGYLPGILSSFISVLIINMVFSYPFFEINFTLSGYPLTFLGMLAISVVTCTLTTQIKEQLQQAKLREKQARLLCEQNECITREREDMRMEAEAEKLRGDLLRSISHDLRTPLTAIYGAGSTLLENDTQLSDDAKKILLGDICEDAQWLIRMVENVLSITRIGDGETKLNTNMEIVEEVLAEAVDKVKQRYRGCRIHVKVPDELLIVPMDSMMIKQVLINLLENAVRHSGSSEPINLNVWQAGGHAIFEVRDRGRGLAEADIPHLFKAFRKDSRSTGDSTSGMGIGLSVCMSIIKAHGGAMTAENSAEGGAVFRFTLPMKGVQSND